MLTAAPVVGNRPGSMVAWLAKQVIATLDAVTLHSNPDVDRAPEPATA
jgi:hypothetical protein